MSDDNGKLIDRKELMLRMREAGINDSAIGRVVGLSRERVGQQLGRSGRYEWTEDKIDIAKKMLEDGESVHSVASAVGRGYTNVHHKMQDFYTPAEWLKIKRLRKKKHSEMMRNTYRETIKVRMLEFKSTLNSGGACPTDLMRFSRSLYSTANFIQPIAKWFEEIGVENTSTWRKG